VSAGYSHIACCVDRSDASLQALAEARRLRALAPARLSLVHVAPLPLVYARGADGTVYPDPADIFSASRRWLEALVADTPGADAVLLHGPAPSAVVEWAGGAGVDLLVAAAHRSRVQRALLGSFASHLAYHAPCSVLLVRPAGGS
jgi:nucleotide-binding universal stress UspA family protein